MGVLSPIIYAILAFMLYRWIAPRFAREEQYWLQIALVAHIAMAFANVLVTKYLLGGGDMLWYHRAGSELAELWWTNPGRWTEEVVKLTLRLTARFPFWVHGAAGGSSTGAMFGVSTWLMILTGKSLYGACVILSCANFFSRLAIYAVLRNYFEGEVRRWMLFATMLFPSALFWTGGLLKESVAMSTLGLAVIGAYWIAERGDFVRGIALVLVGGFASYLVKPYVLFPLILGIPVWYLAARMKRDSDGAGVLLTPLRIVWAVVLGAAGLALLAYLVPSLSVETLSDELASTQQSWDRVSASSASFQLMDAQQRQRGLAGQLAYAPLALLSALTRPWIFEARNPQMLVAAVETTALMIVTVIALRGEGVVAMIRRLMSQPVVLFCLVYVVIFGTAVGLGTGNIGSLSRYRVPFLAFLGVVTVFMWKGRAENSVGASADTIAPSAGGPESALRRGARRKPLAIRNRGEVRGQI